MGENVITGAGVLDIGENTAGRWTSIKLHAGTGGGFTLTGNDATVVGLATAGTLNVGAGTTISKILSASLVYDCGSIAAGVDSTFSITVTGAVAGNPVSIGLSSAKEAGLQVEALCATNDVVTVFLHNANLVSAVDPASRTYKVKVTNF